MRGYVTKAVQVLRDDCWSFKTASHIMLENGAYLYSKGVLCDASSNYFIQVYLPFFKQRLLREQIHFFS